MVDDALLQPGTEYKLYAVTVSGSDTVYTLLTHSTDAEPELSLVTNINNGYDMFYSAPIEHTYTVRKGEPFLLLMGIVNQTASTIFKDSHYKDSQGEPTVISTILLSGSAVPVVAFEDDSLFFTAKLENNIGKNAMISKNTHANTASATSGASFSIILIHSSAASSKDEYLFTWE